MNYEYDLSVVVPCFNEEGNIPALAAKIQSVFAENSINGEIVLVNDASTDGTQTQIDLVKEQNSNIRSFIHDHNKGIYYGWVTGVHNASGKYAVIIDADLQYDPVDINTLYQEILKSDVDIIQGWRKNYHDSMLRNILKTGFSKLLGILFDCKLQDIKSGFILCRKEVFTDILSYNLNYEFPQHYLTISAISKKYTIRQIPITFNKRFSGTSFITTPVLFSLKAFLELPRAFYEFRIMNRRKVAGA